MVGGRNYNPIDWTMKVRQKLGPTRRKIRTMLAREVVTHVSTCIASEPSPLQWTRQTHYYSTCTPIQFVQYM